MKGDDSARLLKKLAKNLSVKKLLAETPSLTPKKLRDILKEASCALGSASKPSSGSTDTWLINIDGGSRGNPGPAGAGAIIKIGDEIIELTRYIGVATNNVAEYAGLIMALEEALKHGAKRIEVRSDSELLVKQMNGSYRVKSPKLAPLFQKANSLAKQFDKITIVHVGRDDNEDADRLANIAIDTGDDH